MSDATIRKTTENGKTVAYAECTCGTPIRITGIDEVFEVIAERDKLRKENANLRRTVKMLCNCVLLEAGCDEHESMGCAKEIAT